MPNILINDNADILAALPVILGFAPEASIVVLLLNHVDGRHEVRHALRFDLDIHAAAKLTTAAAPVFRNASEAIIVAVCGDWIADHAAAILDVLRDSFAELNITTLVRLTAPNLGQPGQWTDIDSGRRGPVTPFHNTIPAAATVLRGHRIASRRDEIVAEFTPTTNPQPFVTEEPIEFLVDTFETVAAIISGSVHPAAYPDLATRVGILVTQDVHARDTMLLLCVDQAAPAARLWTHLANQLAGATRIDTLTLAAACYYAAGDTVRAGIALDIAATDANTSHLDYPLLSQVLLGALQAGFTPTQVRDLIAGIAEPPELTQPGASASHMPALAPPSERTHPT